MPRVAESVTIPFTVKIRYASLDKYMDKTLQLTICQLSEFILNNITAVICTIVAGYGISFGQDICPHTYSTNGSLS